MQEGPDQPQTVRVKQQQEKNISKRHCRVQISRPMGMFLQVLANPPDCGRRYREFSRVPLVRARAEG